MIPRIYDSRLGTPLYWRNEISGVLSDAIMAYFAYQTGSRDEPLTDAQAALVLGYARYYVDAPCWLANATDPEAIEEIEALQQ
jgi:hypothetical protein